MTQKPIREDNKKIAEEIITDLERLNVITGFINQEAREAIVDYVGFVVESKFDSRMAAIRLLEKATALQKDKEDDSRVQLDGGDLSD